MATSKPRITLTLTPQQYQLLKAVADASNQSMSALVGEFIEASVPTLERMAATFQRLKTMNNERKAALAESMERAQEAAERAMAASLGQFDIFLGDVERIQAGDVVEPVARRRRAAGAAAAPAGMVAGVPPVLTGGSGAPNAATKPGRVPRRRSGK